MKIGYPCINRTIGCKANSTFRLRNYSEANLMQKVNDNLDCLYQILKYNVGHNLLFFRISSDLVPFAGHPICTFNWQKHFRKRFREIGGFIKENQIRMSMHPDQFVLINSPKQETVNKSIKELKWHCEALDLMELDYSAKVQIHLGGVYGDKESSIQRFIDNYKKLPKVIRKRIAIENDERMYSLKDCLTTSRKVDIPVVFDSFHHNCLNNGESIRDALESASQTWKEKDGILMTDYSSQDPKGRLGKHAEHIDIQDFKSYIEATKGIDFDIMLEIKDKERSALEAIKVIS